MTGFRTLSYKERKDLEKGVLYLTGQSIDKENIFSEDLSKLKDLEDIFKEVKKKTKNVEEHSEFIETTKVLLDEYRPVVDTLSKNFEKIKRYCEFNERRILDELDSFVLEMRYLSKKTSDPDVIELIDWFISKLTDLVEDEKHSLAKIKEEQSRLSHERSPIKHMVFLLKGKDKQQGQDLEDIQKKEGDDLQLDETESELYPLIKKEIKKLLAYGNFSNSAKRKHIETLKEKLQKILETYGKNLQHDFQIESGLDYGEFQKLETLNKLLSLLDDVKRFYSDKADRFKDDIEGFDASMKRFDTAHIELKKLVSELLYWSQQDLEDDEKLLEKEDEMLDLLKKGFKKTKTSMKGFEFKVDKLDSVIPCYHIKLYKDVEGEDGQAEKKLYVNCLIGATPDMFDNFIKTNDIKGLEDVHDKFPSQIYIPNIEVNELSNNISFFLPYLVHRLYSQDGIKKKTDIIAYPKDIEMLDKNIITGFNKNLRVMARKGKSSIRSEINLVKCGGEYNLKTEKQRSEGDSSVGKSGLKLIQDKDKLHVYFGNNHLTQLDVRPKATGSRIEKKMKSVKKGGRWLNNSKKLSCNVLGNPSDLIFGNLSPKIIHYKKTNILLGVPGNIIGLLVKNKINPDVLNAVLIPDLDEQNISGIVSLAKYFLKNKRKLILLTTQRIYDALDYKFSLLDETETFDGVFVYKPVRQGGEHEVAEVKPSKESDVLLESGLDINLKQVHEEDGFRLKLSFDDKHIAITEKDDASLDHYLETMQLVLSKLGLSKYKFSHIYDYEPRIATALWSITASLRQKYLGKPDKNIYKDLSSVAFQCLVDLGVDTTKIASLNNYSIAKEVLGSLESWAKEQDFDWYLDCDLILHDMGLPPYNTSPMLLLELNRYLRSYSKKRFSLFVDLLHDLKDSFPDTVRHSNLVDIALKEFKKNRIGFLQDKNIRQLKL